MDILVGSSLGIYHFELIEEYLDTTPPSIITVSPAPNSSNISSDLDINVIFNEVINEEALNGTTVIVYGTLGGNLSGNISYSSSSVLTFDPSENFIPNDTITVTLTGNIQDLDGNGLDGNNNGISEGSPADDCSWTFTAGAAIDTKGPVVVKMVVEPESVWGGLPITLTATVDDTSDVSSNIIAAEYFIDNTGSNGMGIALDSVDGAFDSVTEDVISELATEGWRGGNHTIYLHGKDAKDNWGGFQSVDVYVIPESPANWPMFGCDAAHTGYNKAESSIPPFKLKWEKNLSSRNLNPITVANDIIFVTDQVYFNDAVLRALRVEDGSEIWSYSFGDVYSINPPSFAYGNIYVQTCDHTPGSYVSCFDALTGNLKWQSPYGTQWERHYAPTISDGTVFVLMVVCMHMMLLQENSCGL